MTQWRKLKSNKQMIQIIPFNFKSFASIWILINIWKAKIPRLVFTKAILHVILKQQQRKALSFTSNQQMAVDHSNWIITITNGGIYVTNKFSWCLKQWHSFTFLRRLCTQGCLHFFKKNSRKGGKSPGKCVLGVSSSGFDFSVKLGKTS